MQLLFMILLGALQGIAEFLPVSSSGHLALFEHFFFRVEKATALGVFMHLSTLLAVCTVCGKDVKDLFRGAVCCLRRRAACTAEELEARGRFISTAYITLPLIAAAGVDFAIKRTAGAGLSDLIDRYIALRPAAVGALLILNGALLLGAGALPARGKTLGALTFAEGCAVGAFQVFALLPGVSRSGMTVIGCRLVGMDAEEAVRTALVTSVPAVAGALATQLPDLYGARDALPPAGHLFAAALSAYAVGILAILLLTKRTKRAGLRPFAAYCIAAGAAATVAALCGL
ncbi:MAG: undecaprenyl-diphosphate phosphatase [Clostridia bacterium]|nr:undecaprenyl-diphosphate phosphatase [Clostridia bacterium]